MKTEYKYIHFVKIGDKPKTSVWSCRNNKTDLELGQVKWYGAWRQYAFFTVDDLSIVFNDQCLRDIIDFMEQLKR